MSCSGSERVDLHRTRDYFRVEATWAGPGFVQELYEELAAEEDA